MLQKIDFSKIKKRSKKFDYHHVATDYLKIQFPKPVPFFEDINAKLNNTNANELYFDFIDENQDVVRLSATKQYAKGGRIYIDIIASVNFEGEDGPFSQAVKLCSYSVYSSSFAANCKAAAKLDVYS